LNIDAWFSINPLLDVLKSAKHFERQVVAFSEPVTQWKSFRGLLQWIIMEE
jgi:hypothetical protein